MAKPRQVERDARIVQLRKQGLRSSIIAIRLGVSMSTVAKVLREA